MLRSEDARDKLYKTVLLFNGHKNQILKAAEELLECSLELVRIANETHHASEAKLCEEVADALNCLEQMRLILGKDNVDAIREDKLIRLENRV
jgi:hypothetical protein